MTAVVFGNVLPRIGYGDPDIPHHEFRHPGSGFLWCRLEYFTAHHYPRFRPFYGNFNSCRTKHLSQKDGQSCQNSKNLINDFVLIAERHLNPGFLLRPLPYKILHSSRSSNHRLMNGISPYGCSDILIYRFANGYPLSVSCIRKYDYSIHAFCNLSMDISVSFGLCTIKTYGTGNPWTLVYISTYQYIHRHYVLSPIFEVNTEKNDHHQRR